MKALLLFPVLLVLSACEGHYRYPCQDPANWGKLECNNDVCKAEGICTNDTLGRNGFPLVQDQGSQETEPSTENEISSDCVNPVSNIEPKTERLIKVTEKFDDTSEGNEGLDREVVPAVEAEQPLTMNTVVDTAAHNAAAR